MLRKLVLLVVAVLIPAFAVAQAPAKDDTVTRLIFPFVAVNYSGWNTGIEVTDSSEPANLDGEVLLEFFPQDGSGPVAVKVENRKESATFYTRLLQGNFIGYMIATCKFKCRGFAFIDHEDAGPLSLAQGYIAVPYQSQPARMVGD